MNEKRVAPAPVATQTQTQTHAPAYKSWKNKEVTADGKAIKKDVNLSSVTDFPELVKGDMKKSVFEGTSLAAKLKEVIQAEEEAAILKRIKKGETAEDIFRESCAVLPLKTPVLSNPKELVAPWWVMDTTEPIVLPRFNPKTPQQVAEERRYKRYGIHPANTMLFDDSQSECDMEDDRVSLPSLDEESIAEPDEQVEAS
jgi:hypothetical protein